MKFSREWATPLTAGSFALMALTGLLMFFHFDRGLNHLAHEWLGFILIFGVGCHLTSNFSGLKKHLSSKFARICVFIFLVVFVLSFFQPEQKKRPPNWAGPVRALSEMSLVELSNVAKVSPNEVRVRLAANGINSDSDEQSIEEIVGPNLRKQAAALSAIFKLKDD
jgi:hypothetical protein